VACWFILLACSMHGYAFAHRLGDAQQHQQRHRHRDSLAGHQAAKQQQQQQESTLKKVPIQWSSQRDGQLNVQTIHIDEDMPNRGDFESLVETRNEIQQRLTALQQAKSQDKLVLTSLAIAGLVLSGLALLLQFGAWSARFITDKLLEWQKQAMEAELLRMKTDMCANLGTIERDFQDQMASLLTQTWVDSDRTVQQLFCAEDGPMCKMVRIMREYVQLSVTSLCADSSAAAAAYLALEGLNSERGRVYVEDTRPLVTKFVSMVHDVTSTIESVAMRPAEFVHKLGETLQWWHFNPTLSLTHAAISNDVIRGFLDQINAVMSTPAIAAATSVFGMGFSLYSIASSISKIAITTKHYYDDRKAIMSHFALRKVDMVAPMCKILAVIMYSYALIHVPYVSNTPKAITTATPAAPAFLEQKGLFDDLFCCGGPRKKYPVPDKDKMPAPEPRIPPVSLDIDPKSRECVPCTPLPTSESKDTKVLSLAKSYESARAQFLQAECPKLIGWGVTESTTMDQLSALIPKGKSRQIIYNVVALYSNISCNTLWPDGASTEVKNVNGTHGTPLTGTFLKKGDSTPRTVHLCQTTNPEAAAVPGSYVTGVNAYFYESKDDWFEMCIGVRPGKVKHQTCSSVLQRFELNQRGFSPSLDSALLCSDSEHYKTVTLMLHTSNHYAAPPLRSVYLSPTPRVDGEPKKGSSGEWVLNGDRVQQGQAMNVNSCHDSGSPLHLVEERDYFYYDEELMLGSF